MKRTIPLILLIGFTCSCYAQFDRYADSLLTNKQYFRLNEHVGSNAIKNELSKTFYRAFIHNFFNKPAESNVEIQKLLQNFKKQLNAPTLVKLIQLQIDNDLKIFDYKQAYNNSLLLLQQYGNELAKDEADDIANSAIIWKSLKDTPPQKSVITKDSRINYRRDLSNLITVPVSFGNYQDEYVFDTGANISVITESNAIKGNLKIMPDTFEVAAITGIKLKAKIACALEFKLGDIVVHNAVFMVFPDSALSFAGGKYKIQGIIGFPVIEQLKEIRISKNGFMEIPLKPENLKLGNFGLDGLTPVVNVEYQNQKLPFTFDTGAQVTLFNKSFYTAFKSTIDSIGTAEDVQVGGAGGAKTIKSYRVPQLLLAINGKKAILKNSTVKLYAEGDGDKFYFGNLGQDVFNQFDITVINFKAMYVQFSGK